jgi:PAS domain S-box-containing protein
MLRSNDAPTSSVDRARTVMIWPSGESQVASLLRSHVWSDSLLGTPESWPQSLRSAVDFALECRFPMIVLWGAELIQIYNDAYRELMGTKHPSGLGQPTRDCWPEVWAFNEPIYARVLQGEALTFEDQLFPISRHGYLEDAYFTLCYSPLRNEAGNIAGVLVTVFETTAERLVKAALQASKVRLTELFQQAPAFVAVLRGSNHVFEMVNPRYEELVGGRQVIGKSVAHALPEAEEQGYIQLLDNVYATGEPFTANGVRFSLARAIGGGVEDRFLDLIYHPLRESDGSISGVIALGVDVTESRLALQAATEAEAELQWTLQLNPHNPWTADATGNLTAVSPQWLASTGLSLDELQSTGWAQISHPEDLGQMQLSWSQALKTGEPYDLEYRMRLASGEMRWMRSRALPRRSANGEIVRWYGSIEDIHVRKLAELALMQSEKLAAVGRLASSIAHEINNPLEAVTNLLYLARTTQDDAPAVQTYVLAAEAELKRVAQITNQTLRFHKQSTRQQETYCADLIKEVLAIYQRRLSDASVSVELRKRANAPVFCFDGEIRQILSNLIGNAFDARKAEGARLLIRSREGVDWKTGRIGLIMTVADNGVGMSSMTRRKIFEPFFTTKGIGGVGLGLWVSCEIVKRHRGELRVRSSQSPRNSGTVFTLFLPFVKPQSPSFAKSRAIAYAITRTEQ